LGGGMIITESDFGIPFHILQRCLRELNLKNGKNKRKKNRWNRLKKKRG
jgi:hypothetical protein